MAARVLAFLLSLSVLFNLYLWQRPVTGQGIKVLAVLDGDTVVLDGQVRMRLRHVDAPELGNCGGSEAKDLLTSLLEGKSVQVKEEIMDTYGRPLALLYLNDTLINQSLLESGWVRYHHDTSSVEGTLKAIGKEMKDNKIGIFSQLCLQISNPDNPDCNIKGNIDQQGDIKRYYYPGCVQYDYTLVEKDLGEQWFCTQKEAQVAGYAKAATCR
ncbi:MAG TPA: thermonuclease family protein [Patescibacteria group bacterium]|nr:thermonuclease family protein [Patescibacteria group bacterium]